jgi:predicted nicotinamide N-methyase
MDRVDHEPIVEVRVALDGGEDLVIAQPEESAGLPDDRGVEWAPMTPYWSVLWRSGVALAREVAGEPPRPGSRVLELGCGLGLPSIVAARAGAEVLATDGDEEAFPFVDRNAARNGVALETMQVDWERPEPLLARGRFDLVLVADCLYERDAVEPLLDLLPQLAGEAWIATPHRHAAEEFVARARARWQLRTSEHGVIGIHRIRMR